MSKATEAGDAVATTPTGTAGCIPPGVTIEKLYEEIQDLKAMMRVLLARVEAREIGHGPLTTSTSSAGALPSSATASVGSAGKPSPDEMVSRESTAELRVGSLMEKVRQIACFQLCNNNTHILIPIMLAWHTSPRHSDTDSHRRPTTLSHA